MNVVQPIKTKDGIKAVKEILHETGSRNLLLFLLGINTGLRVSDLLNLRVRDVKNKDYVQIREKKTRKTRIFPIPNEIRPLLNEYVQYKPLLRYLFKSRSANGPISRVQAYRIIHNACEIIGLENIGTHTLRKTFGYHFYKQTKDIALLQKIFNHSSSTITMRYIGMTQEMINEHLLKFKI